MITTKKKDYLVKYNKVPKNREKHKIAAKKYRLKNREKIREYFRGYRRNHPERFRKKYAISKEYYRLKHQRKKLRCLEYYGGNPPICACCGEKEKQFLSLDHTNGGGNLHRREIGKGNICNWIIKNKFPQGFQVLCYNCNCAKGFFGKCPHKK